MKFRHAIITRFNVRYRETAHKEAKGVNPGWLAERFDLFESYCLPTVLAQTCQEFVWFIYFDSASPAVFVERAHRARAGRDNIRLMFCDFYDQGLLERDLRAELVPEPEWLLTTRLDNDDGLRRDFVRRLHETLGFSGTEALNFPNGVVYTGQRTYLFRHESNAFLSLLEPFDGFKTVLFVQHQEMPKMASVRQIEGDPAWLQVVHQSNISNRVRGRRVPAASALEGFAIAAEGTAQRRSESRLTLLLDNLVYGAWRVARDKCIEIGKWLRRAAKPRRGNAP
jgi:Putative rhamnosyl transferase